MLPDGTGREYDSTIAVGAIDNHQTAGRRSLRLRRSFAYSMTKDENGGCCPCGMVSHFPRPSTPLRCVCVDKEIGIYGSRCNPKDERERVNSPLAAGGKDAQIAEVVVNNTAANCSVMILTRLRGLWASYSRHLYTTASWCGEQFIQMNQDDDQHQH